MKKLLLALAVVATSCAPTQVIVVPSGTVNGKECQFDIWLKDSWGQTKFLRVVNLCDYGNDYNPDK